MFSTKVKRTLSPVLIYTHVMKINLGVEVKLCAFLTSAVAAGESSSILKLGYISKRRRKRSTKITFQLTN